MKSRNSIALFVFFFFLAGVALAQTKTTLYFPRLATTDGTTKVPDNSEFTGFAIANLDTSTASLTFTAYDTNGVLISGPNITNPATRSLAPRRQLPIVDVEVFGPGWVGKNPVGWMKVESTVTRVVGFFLTWNGSLNVMDGADVGSSLLTSFVFPEIGGAGFTQFHIANPGTGLATLNLELIGSNGLTKSTASRNINANGAMVEAITGIFPGALPDPSDYVRVTSSRGVVPFEFLGAFDQYVHGLNGQAIASGSTSAFSPQYVVGGPNYRTTVSIINLDASAGVVVIDFIKNDGTVMANKQVEIPARGKAYVSRQDFFVPATSETEGYLRIAGGGLRLAGAVVFSNQKGLPFSTALPLVTSLQNTVVYSQLASNATYFTGLAIINPNSTSIDATIEAYDDQGTVLASKTETIPGWQRISRVLTQYFPQLTGVNRQSGYLKVTTNNKAASFALFGTTNLSVMSAVPPQLIPDIPVTSYDGSWAGTASTTRPVEFTVQDNKITRFKIGFVFTAGSSSCTTDITITSSLYLAVIADNSFAFTFQPSGLTTSISGTFTSQTAMTGTFGQVNMNNFKCGAMTINGYMAGGTFSAAK